MSLVEKYGYIEEIPYELLLKTLDHFKIDSEGRVDVIFLSRIGII